MDVAPRILIAGDRALVVEYGRAIDEATNRRVRALTSALAARAVAGVVELVPTYASAMVHYDPTVTTPAALQEAILEADRHLDDVALPPSRLIEVPTVYGGRFGPDLDAVAVETGLSPREVIEIHHGRDYLVYMMGFMAGFPYLGGLSPRIAVPRLPSPRTKVPAGTVGIALEQTGIYPTDSPGGWRLIGWTPLRIFDATHDPPVLFEAGDRIRFVPMTEAEARQHAPA